jgi:hypothetical protein
MGSMGSAGDGLDSYAQGVYEHRDGAPIDISNCYSDRTSVGGSGSGSTYAHGWDRIFAKKSPKEAAATTGSVMKSGKLTCVTSRITMTRLTLCNDWPGLSCGRPRGSAASRKRQATC